MLCVSPHFSLSQLVERSRALLNVLQLNARVVPKNAEQQTLQFSKVFSRHVVMHFHEGVVAPSPFLHLSVVRPQAAGDSLLHNSTKSSYTNVDHFVTIFGLFVLVENIEASSL